MKRFGTEASQRYWSTVVYLSCAFKMGEGGEAAEMHGCDTAGIREEEEEEGGGGCYGWGKGL